jgi:AsmA protein
MKKLLKTLLIIIGLIVVLSVVATIAISILVDADKINSQVKAAVKQQTGGDLDIAGALSWSIYPALSLSLADVSYTNNGDTKPLARFDALQLSVELMPLFSGNVKVSGISFDGMTLNLAVAEDGTQNWVQSRPAATNNQTNSAPASDTDTDSDSDGTDLAIAIATISITNATINYNDLSTGSTASLSKVSFNSSNANIAGNTFPMALGFSLKATNPNASVVVDMTANAAINASDKTVQLENLVVNKKVQLDDANGKLKIAATVAGELMANGVSEVMAITGLTVSAEISGDATNSKTLPVNFSGDIKGDNKAGTFELSNYQLNALDLNISGSVKATEIDSDINASGPITISEFNPKELLIALGQTPPATANKSALTKLSLSANVNYQGTSVMLQQLSINLDQSKIKGFAGLSNIDQQLVVADLTVDSINIDDYMPPTATEPGATSAAAGDKPASAPAAETTAIKSSAETPLPLADLKTINALIKLAINELTINNLAASNFNLSARANLGLVDLKNLSVDLYSGNIKTSGELDARPNAATLKAKLNITGVAMKPILTAVSEVDWFNGSTNLTADITTKGNTVEAWQRSLNGVANFAMTDLLAEGISIDKQLCQGIALINSKSLSNQWSENTQLDNLNGKIRFINGTMQNDSLTGGSSTLKLTGSGWVSPEKNKINYKLGLQVAGDQISQDPACAVNERYRDISWPLECKGQLDAAPKDLCGIDKSAIKDILQELLTEEVKRKANNKIDDYLKEKNLEGVGDLLKGLFN